MSSILLSAKTTNPSLTEVFDCCGHTIFRDYFVCVCAVCGQVCVFANDMFLFLLFELYTAGCPTLKRSDYGTENVSIATCQMAFRHDHDDQFADGSSFIFGSSIRNTVNIMCFVASILTHGSSCSELRAGGQDSEVLEVTGGLIYLKCVL